jgi:transcriptional regulator with XRE-family HTH domain
MPEISDLDLGLEVLAALRSEGESFTEADIAEVCGCSQAYISQIAQKAIRKLRHRLRFTPGVHSFDDLLTSLGRAEIAV